MTTDEYGPACPFCNNWVGTCAFNFYPDQCDGTFAGIWYEDDDEDDEDDD